MICIVNFLNKTFAQAFVLLTIFKHEICSRDHVMSERKHQMKIKKEVQRKVQKDIEEEGKQAGANAKKYNL